MFTNEFISLCHRYAKKKTEVLHEMVEDSKKICKYSIDKANSLHKEDEDIAKVNVTLPGMSDSEYWNLV